MTEALRSQKFIPVKTNGLCSCNCEGVLVEPTHSVLRLQQALGIPVRTNDSNYGVFAWMNPLDHLPATGEEYPFRAFEPPREMTEDDRRSASQMVQRYGAVIPYTADYYSGCQGDVVRLRDNSAIIYEVPDHQARGFRDSAILFFQTQNGEVIKFAVCTKGSGMTGYWIERRKEQMLDALNKDSGDYPLNPDLFHARNHKGQSVGQREGDEIVWVGCASDTVTKWEVEGFNTYEKAGIFTPICLPVRAFEELPLATGDFIPTQLFVQVYDPASKLVYLAKAWGMETRIWGNHFSHKNLTAAHLLSTKEGDRFVFEEILGDLKGDVLKRRQKLDKEEAMTQTVMLNTDRSDLPKIFGFAGTCMKNAGLQPFLDEHGRAIPSIISINMTENVARAGAVRLFGKPVAWHLENVGRWGEVSGGERIYGRMSGMPDAREYHSLFSYLFDGYMAVAIEWAAAGKEYISIEAFYENVRARIMKLNPDHWISAFQELSSFVDLCLGNLPTYEVKFRSEDTYPLIAVEGTTDRACMNRDEKTKNWKQLRVNMNLFLRGLREVYSLAETV